MTRNRDVPFHQKACPAGSAHHLLALGTACPICRLEPRPATQWCPVCKTYHEHVGEKTDAGRLTRPCPLLATDDPRNRP